MKKLINSIFAIAFATASLNLAHPLEVSARLVRASNGPASAAKVANLLEEAAKNFRDKNYQYSIDLYKQALVLDDGNPGVHFGLGASYLAIKDYPLAVEYLQRAIELNPALVEAYFSLALAYQGMSQPTQSLKVYRQGLGLDLGTGLPRTTYSQVTISNPDDDYQAPRRNNDNPSIASRIGNNNFSSLEIIETKEEPLPEYQGSESEENTFSEETRSFAAPQNAERQEPANTNTSQSLEPKPSSEEDYYLRQIVELNSELKNNPDDYQTKYKLGLFYAKAKMFDNAQVVVNEIVSFDRDLSEQLKKEIEQIKKGEKAASIPQPLITSNDSAAVSASSTPSNSIAEKNAKEPSLSKAPEAKKAPQTFDSPYKKKRRFFRD